MQEKLEKVFFNNILYLQVASICRGIALKAYRRSYGSRTDNQRSLSPQNLSFLDVPCGLKKSANFWRLPNFVWQTFEFKLDIFPVFFLAGFATIVVIFSTIVRTFEFSRFLTIAGHFDPALFQPQGLTPNFLNQDCSDNGQWTLEPLIFQPSIWKVLRWSMGLKCPATY